MEYTQELEGEGEGIYGFSRKKAASDGVEYFNDEAEERDLKYIVENSCMRCDRLLSKREVRVVPPQYLQSKDKYVMQNIVARRVMCVPCYNRITSSTREKIKEHYKSANSKLNENLAKVFLRGFATRQH